MDYPSGPEADLYHQPANLTPEQKAQTRAEFYEPIEAIIQMTVEKLTGQEPAQWLIIAYHTLASLQHSLSKSSYPWPIQEYLSKHLDDVLAILKGEFALPPHTDPDQQLEYINERARAVIHEISDLILLERDSSESIQDLHLSIEQILSLELVNGYVFRLSDADDQGTSQFQIYSPTRDQWFNFPLPPTDTMVHKGGFPRVVLKIIAGAVTSTIEAELPPNDLDVIAWGEESEAYKTAAQIGVDLSGVEITKDTQPDYPKWLKTRDIDLNSCFIGKDGLIYSAEAFQAARTGRINPLPSYRGLYGSNMFYHQGELLYTGRDLMRAIKTVAEGKAVSFPIKELNRQVDMGIYILALAKKLLSKRNWPELLDKYYYLLKQTGQVRDDEPTIWAVLDRVLQIYPFFAIDDRSEPESTDVTKWLYGKLGKQALISYRAQYKIPSLMELERRAGDTEIMEISLADYQAEAEELQTRSIDGLGVLLENARLRCQ